ERELLRGFIIPRPFAGLVAIGEQSAGLVRPLDLPRVEPALPVQRARVAGHVGLEAHVAPAEGESPAANAVHIRHQREAAGVENVFQRTVAFAQYWPGAIFAQPFESRNTPAHERT